MNGKFYLLGLFAGDGWFASRGIQIATNSAEFAEKIAELSHKTFGKSLVRERRYTDGHRLFIVSVWDKKLHDEFRMLLQAETGAKSKTFKPPIMPEADRRAFIAGLFDAEASTYFWYGKPRIGMGIYNKVAAEFIKDALRSDDIKCQLSVCKSGEFKLDITGERYVRRFFELYSVLRLTFPDMGKS